MSIPPNTTLYVKNIEGKIKKPELRRQLYCLFVTYGRILDIIATKVNSMRGQAFIVFADLASSTAAMRALDGFIFYGKPLRIDYAQSKSKATIVAERGPEALFDPDLLANNSKKKTTFSSAGADLKGRERKRAREEAGGKAPIADDSGDDEEDDEDVVDGAQTADIAEPEGKKAKLDSGTSDKGAGEDGEEEEMQMGDSDDDD